MDKPLFCCCCLSTQDLQSLFTSCDTPEKVLMYADMIKRCFFLEMWLFEDNDPLICSLCVQRLQDAYEFRAQIRSIQDLLNNATAIISVDNEIVIQITKPDEEIEIEHGTESYSHEELKEEHDLHDIVLTEVKTESKDLKPMIPCERDSLEKIQHNTSTTIKNPRGMKKQQDTQKTDSVLKVKSKPKRVRNRKVTLPYKIDNETLSCPICQLSFMSRAYLNTHMTEHYPNYICDHCGKCFVARSYLTQHVRIHIDNMYPCKICGKKNASQSLLNSHMERHSGNKERFCCPQCSERFGTYYRRQKHLGEAHNVDVLKYKCDSCEKSFCVSGELRSHIRRMHLNLKRHACEECSSAFYSKTCLKTHMLKHTGEKKYSCEVCNKSYGRGSTLKEHMRIHNNDKRFTCQECGTSFTQKCTLKGHMQSHHKFILSQDGEIVIRKKESIEKIEIEDDTEGYREMNEEPDLDGTVLTQMEQKEHKIDDLPFQKCKQSENLLRKKYKVIGAKLNENQQEIKSVSSENTQVTKPVLSENTQGTKPVLSENTQGTKPVLSENTQGTKPVLREKTQETEAVLSENPQETDPVLCENSQETEPILSGNSQETESQEHINDGELLCCPKCDLRFTTHFYLDNHMTIHGSNFICDYCGELCSTKRQLQIHLIRHIHKNEPCKICGKILQNPNNMGRHLKIHSGVKATFRCPQCSERFNNYYSRQKHLGNVHNMNVDTFKCDSCDLSFCVSGKLRAHVRNVHLNLKRHACTECPSAFFTKYCLKSHMLKHSGEKKYTCEVCKKSYARRYTLNEHMRIHNNDKRFTCQECGRSFTQKCTLNGHLRAHAKQNERIHKKRTDLDEN